MIRLAVLALLAAVLSGCARDTPPKTQGFLLYGMLIQLSLPGQETPRMETALGAVEQVFKQEYAALHPWQDSPLTRLNAALAGGEWTPLPPELRPIIERSRTLEAQSGGAFSPAIGALVKLWGFHGNDPDRPRTPPHWSDLARLMEPPPRMTDLDLEEGRVRCRNPNVSLDFNAIAEGWAAERAAERLRALGIRDALLDAGGDLRVLGSAGGRPWRVAIQDPFVEGPLASLEVEGDVAVFTSGSYRKRFVYQGVSYSHVLDPRSGWPSRGLVGVTVVANDAVLADAAATALLAAGLEDAPSVARHLGLADFLLVDEQGRIHATPTLAARLRLLRDDRPLHILGTPRT